VILERLKKKPYFDAIAHLIKIKDCNAPIEKIRCIA
jgi:hypothetical protein